VSPYSGYLIETFATLACVCAVAVAILWVARKLGAARPTGPLELQGVLPLDARRSIVLVKVGEVVFVVGVGEGGFTKLGELRADDVPAPVSQGSTPFADVLARALGRRPPPEHDDPRPAPRAVDVEPRR
jgi:flagellar biogenesis protein FliO